MGATVLQTGIGPILAACRDRLVDELALDASMVKIVARASVPKFTGDRDCLIKPGPFLSIQQVFDGAGRTCCRITRTFEVIARSRILLDQKDSDEIRLLGSTSITESGQETAAMGQIAWEESLAVCLAGFMPTNDGTDFGDQLVAEPIRIFDGSAPEKEPQTTGWLESSVQFEVQYLLLLNGEII